MDKQQNPALDKICVKSFYPFHIKKYGIGHAANMIAFAMNTANVECILYTYTLFEGVEQNNQVHLMPKLAGKLLIKLLPEKYWKCLIEYFFYKSLNKNDIVHLWPGASINLHKKIKKRGCKLVIEFINCHNNYSLNLLESEENRLNISGTHSITKEKIIEDDIRLNLADFVFSPSPAVTKSILSENINESKIIKTSYGLNSNQIMKTRSIHSDNSAYNGLFVGRVGLRKGVLLLIEYWLQSENKGILTIVGKIDDNLSPLLSEYKNNPQLNFVDFTENINFYYSKSDVFLMNSLEEGSPLVTYLAIGAGLPCLVSPMGGEGIVRDGIEGYIIPPYNKENWISRINKLMDYKLRGKFSYNSHERSKHFTWQEIGNRRANAIFELITKENK